MSQTLILLRKNLLNFSRARAAIAITFIVPIGLIYLFGQVFGLNRSDPGPSGIPLAVVNLSPDPVAQELVAALKAEPVFRVVTDASAPKEAARPLTEASARAGLQENQYHYALILPADLIPRGGFGIHLLFLTNPRNAIEAQTVNGILQKTIFSKVPQLLGQTLQRSARARVGNQRYDEFSRSMAGAISRAFGGDPAEIQRAIDSGDFLGAPARSGGAKAGAGDLLTRLIRIDTEQVAGANTKNPMAARLVGGYAIMFLLFAVSGSAATMFEERSTGVFQRLLSSPVRPAHILWSRFLFGLILGLAQLCALFLAGRLFFGLEIFSHAGALCAVTIAAAAACSSFGMLIAAVAPNATAAQGIATFVVIAMSAIGGAWFPVTFMPGYMQAISKLTLVYWAVEGFTDVLWAGRSLMDVLPKVGVLAAIAFGVMSVALWRYKRSSFFD